MFFSLQVPYRKAADIAAALDEDRRIFRQIRRIEILFPRQGFADKKIFQQDVIKNALPGTSPVCDSNGVAIKCAVNIADMNPPDRRFKREYPDGAVAIIRKNTVYVNV
ncbi:hypothetical protein SDC9_92345 [bioreactor metagenome]|uniref:Uncharacterized protein n=1 Tax=bioreactor metagenome TaxID=1076179 RepID=A0A644ZXJ9_9ZZZZ